MSKRTPWFDGNVKPVRVGALKNDARYRWLRETGQDVSAVMRLAGDELDAYIDTAMAADRAEKGGV